MLIPLNDIIVIYEKMLQQLNVEYVSVLIFTSLDIDALCSLKILTKFLKSQSINFKVYPAINYTELQKNIQQTKIYEQVKLFLFINCGGVIDLTEKWFMAKENAYVFLFDVNKPLNHKNIDHKCIHVVNDQHSELQERITSQDIKRLQQLDEFDLDQIDIQDYSDEDDQREPDNKSPKRNSEKLMIQKLKRKKVHLEEKVAKYYNHTFFGLPSSYSLYRLVRELNKASNYSLWYAIVGMTSMYLENNISREAFETLTGFYRSDMIKFNPQNNDKREKGEIYTRKGYQFPLLNSWSLYESMMNSPYLMVKLGLWNDKGVIRLHQILTKIGISLSESKQQYKYMLKQSKQSLEENIFKIAEDYNLIDITFESFMKQADSASSYMASDYYYFLLAILEKPLHKSTAEQLIDHRLNCFWDAYSILDGSQQMIIKSIQEYKQMSKIIMKQVKDVIERDNIISMSKMHFANIRCDNKQKRLFDHQNTLMRFAYLLMGIQKQRKVSKGKGPFILSLQDMDKNVCTIVGVVSDFKSKLGTQFDYVATHLKLQNQHDKFVANVMVIPKQNLMQFVKKMDQLLQGRKLEQIK